MRATGKVPVLAKPIDRRELLRLAVTSPLLGLSWIDLARAAVPPPPRFELSLSATGDGVIGPYGEVRVADLAGTAVPILVTAAGGLAVMNIAGRAAFVRFGNDLNAITVTSAGVRFGAKGSQLPWSRDVFSRLAAAIVSDSQKARGAVRLRSALLTAYPEAITRLKKSPNPRVVQSMARSAAAVGALSIARCTTTTITETVYETVTRVVEVWRSAESQFQQCYDREMARSPCKEVPLASAVCAAGICAVRGFVDVLVSAYEVLEQVAREVVRTVVSCTRPMAGQWPNPLDVLQTAPGKYSLAQPRAAFSGTDVLAATALLERVFRLVGGGTSYLGQFSTCLLQGRWSLASLDTRIDFGNGTIAVPYGVMVCLTRSCATQFSAVQIATEVTRSWETLLSVLAALSPAYFAAIMALGIVLTPPTALLGSTLAAAGPVIVACAAVVLGFMILALVHGTAIIGQMTVWQAAGVLDANQDGYVCIEHASFALALVKAATLGVAPAELVPPVVNPA